MAANSRAVSTRKTAAPRPARQVKDRDEELTAAQAQEVEANAVTSDGYITVPMTGSDGTTEDVQVLLSSKWRASAMRAIRTGDFDGFMRAVLFEDDYEVYLELDPEAEDVEDFAGEVVRLTGENPGKPSGSARSSKRTRRS